MYAAATGETDKPVPLARGYQPVPSPDGETVYYVTPGPFKEDFKTATLVARMLEGFERRTDLPAVVNTSLNTAGRPMVDDPRDALECFGSAPIEALALGPFLVRRRGG